MSFHSPVWCCGRPNRDGAKGEICLCRANYLDLSFPSWIHCCLRGRWTRSRCRAGLGTPLEFPEDQTGSGPAFNTGCSNEAVPGAEHFVQVFKDAEMVVWLSGWCATMVRDDYPELLAASSLRKLDRHWFASVIRRLQPHRRYREDSGAGRTGTATLTRHPADRNLGIQRARYLTISTSK
jgi:hypothetical protein